MFLCVAFATDAQIINPGSGGAGAKPPSYSSGTVTASISAVTLCTTTNCPAGNYLISVYTNETGTGCTTVGAGSAKIQLTFIDNQAQSRTLSPGSVPMINTTGGSYSSSGLVPTTTGLGFAAGTYVVNTNGSAVAGSDSIQIATTLTACTTPGSWTGYQVRAFITPLP